MNILQTDLSMGIQILPKLSILDLSLVWVKNACHDMAIVGEPCNVDDHANIYDYIVPITVCTYVLYTLIVTVQLSR